MVRWLALVVLLAGGTVQAQSLAHQVGTLHPSSAFLDDFSGTAVAVDGDTVVVGIPGDDDVAQDAGAVAVFVEVGGAWVEQALLRPADLTGSAAFGSSLDLSADLLVVGAPEDDAGAADGGSVYVFRRTGGVWTEEAKLRPASPGLLARFGSSVSLSGTSLAVGSPGRFVGGAFLTGAVYVYDSADGPWTEQAELVDPLGDGGDLFGEALGLDDDLLVVGAPGDEVDVGLGAGSARVFTRSAGRWSTGPQLALDDLQVLDRFGTAVAVHAGRIAIGSPLGASPAGSGFGRVSLFEESGGTWSLTQSLSASDGAANDQFGSTLSLTGTRMLVGAPSVDAEASAFPAGAAYLFVDAGAGFVESHRFDADETGHDDEFGLSLDLMGDRLVVGAPQDDDAWFDAGAAYVFDVVLDPWTDVGGGKAGSGGVTPALTATGPLLAGSENAFQLTGAPPNGTTHVVMGALYLGVPFKGGTFLPSADILVLNQPLDGAGEHVLPFTWFTGVPVGTPFWTQHWVQDPGASFNLSASNGLLGEAQ
jgi:hypothetical protein